MFCPKCGSIVLPKKEGKNNVIRCACGYTNAKAETIEIKEEVKRKDVVLEPASDNDEMLPITDAECQNSRIKKLIFGLFRQEQVTNQKQNF